MSGPAERECLPPETSFLLRVMAAGLGGAALPSAPPPELDWPRFLLAVRHHRVTPLMGPVLAAEAPVPEAVRAELTELRRKTALRMLLLGNETVRAISGLESAGIEAVALKGPALSVQIYGDPWRRLSRDIDLLVRPEALAGAMACLRRLGYGETGAMVSRDLNGITLRHSHRPFPIELHLQLADDDRMFPCARLRPFETAVPVNIGGAVVRTLAPEAAAVFAAYHGTKHVWRRLCWLGDMAAMARGGAIDWPAAVTLARRMGSERQLALALVLAEDLLEAPLPPALGADARLACRARRAAAALWPVFADGGIDSDQAAFRRFGRLRYVWWDAALHTRPVARLASLAVRAQPSHLDRDWFRLPAGLGFLYPVVRVVRVLCEAWSHTKSC